jgi:hypothetical protein
MSILGNEGRLADRMRAQYKQSLSLRRILTGSSNLAADDFFLTAELCLAPMANPRLDPPAQVSDRPILLIRRAVYCCVRPKASWLPIKALVCS